MASKTQKIHSDLCHKLYYNDNSILFYSSTSNLKKNTFKLNYKEYFSFTLQNHTIFLRNKFLLLLYVVENTSFTRKDRTTTSKTIHYYQQQILKVHCETKPLLKRDFGQLYAASQPCWYRVCFSSFFSIYVFLFFMLSCVLYSISFLSQLPWDELGCWSSALTHLELLGPGVHGSTSFPRVLICLIS